MDRLLSWSFSSEGTTRGLGLLGRVTGRRLKETPKRKARQIADPDVHESPRGTAILIRGGASWVDDDSFETLEEALAQQEVIEVVRYSYLGPDFSCYTQWDSFERLQEFEANLHNFVDYVDEYIRRLDAEPTMVRKPLYLLGHSAGGLIIAHWIMMRSRYLDRPHRIFYFATPFSPNQRSVPVAYPSREKPTFVSIPRSLELGQLVDRSPRSVVMRSDDDGVFHLPEETSLELNVGPRDPQSLIEQPFNDNVNHFRICNENEVVDFVMEIISQDMADM